MSQKYGGKLLDDYSAMRGPCPEEFHIPSTDEWISLCGILTTTFSMEGNATTMGTYLKMPMAGYLYNTSGNIGGVGTTGQYRSSSASSADYAYHLRFHSSLFYPHNQARRTYGDSIRCFKDTPVIPTSSWTVLYQGTGSAGIFRNSSLGLISVSGDGITWYTIQDKNLGATTVYNDGDTLTDDNCGYFYQWGNNYGFSHSGTVTASSTQVNASGYGPGNYYLSSTFITGYNDWSNVQNDNLRGGVTGMQQNPANIIKKYYGGKTIVNYEDMQGPCPTGFHVSTSKDWTRTMNIGISLGAWDSTGDHMSIYLKIPPTGLRTNQSDFYGDGEMSVYLTPEITDDEDAPGWYYPKAFQFVFNEQYSLPNEASLGGANICDGCSIRPFKNVSVVPDNNWTVLYQGSGSAGIFHDETSGLISLSSDGENRITLADKNLGATEVYNYGNTLSHSNCGKLYQWGNNFGFLWQGNLLTTTTKVDGSLYGPGNYYSFNEYYIEMGDMTDRSSVRNDNRRGGVTGAERLAKVKKVYYGGTLVDDYSAMRGPCSEGFHVPSVTELQGLKTIMDGLSLTTGDGWRINLHMPFAGCRHFSDASLSSRGSYGFYWSSSPILSSSGYARSLRLDSSRAIPEDNNYCANGYLVRSFKNSYMVPDSSWTVVQGTLGNAGIFWNQSQGLISITDGSTGYTIMDKNLGATTVYNDGDTLTDANCGYFYQWGNNYGFPHSGTVTTSNTRVDASSYGPTNPYYSDTFIIGNYNWSSVRNNDLWGGITGVQQKPILIREDNS